ncbi:MAG: phenylalanine--tRNA ligase subunit alpha [Spirochaetes bacterium]|nr:phenylalanine--tRNA ligase subunit alpha [Spirochaetota bacterium]
MSDPNTDELREQIQAEIPAAPDGKALEELRIRFLGKKGVLADLVSRIAQVPPEERKAFGKTANDLKALAGELLDARAGQLEAQRRAEALSTSKVDVRLPGRRHTLGTAHPITQVRDEILSAFNRMGFLTVDGPEIETDYYNFEALNIPPEHPARDGQDSFYLAPGTLLRTQTSTVQIRVMEQVKPPLAIVSAGRVFRRDTLDATHAFMFHQIEGLLVAEQVSFAHLKGILLKVGRDLFGAGAALRFAPDFFPFTEPSCQLCVNFPLADGRSRWLEVLGAGLVNPVVLKGVGIDPEKYSGLAFGMGVERIAMCRWGIQDIRLFTENDKRFLDQF